MLIDEMVKFNQSFELFNRIIQLFNKRRVPGEAPCDCHHINATIHFAQTFKTDPEFKYSGEWVVIVSSQQLGDRRFGGAPNRVIELVVQFLEEASGNLLESMIANQNEWFLKQEDRHSILDCYQTLQKIKEEGAHA